MMCACQSELPTLQPIQVISLHRIKPAAPCSCPVMPVPDCNDCSSVSLCPVKGGRWGNHSILLYIYTLLYTDVSLF